MGTNYYLLRKVDKNIIGLTPCEWLKPENMSKWNAIGNISEMDSSERIHIGKSSYGWQFLFNANNFEYFKPNKKSLHDFLKSGLIIDEYGCPITHDEFLKMVRRKYHQLNGATSFSTHRHEQACKEFEERFNVTVDKANEFYIDKYRFTIHTEFC